LISTAVTSGVAMRRIAYVSGTAWMLFPAYAFLLPVGGYWHLISNFQIGNLFAKRQGTVITLLSGCFDSSSFMFVVFRVLYMRYGISVRTEFLVYSGAALFLLLNALFNLPRSRIPFPLPDDWTKNWKPKPLNPRLSQCSSEKADIKLQKIDENDDVKESAETDSNGNARARSSLVEKRESNVPPPLKRLSSVIEPKFVISKDASFLSCVTSANYIFHVVFVSVNQLKLYCFMNTVFDFIMTFDLPEDTRDHYMNAFGIAQLTGLVWAPIMGLLVDRNKQHRSAGSSPLETLQDFVLPLFLACLTGLLFSACLLVPIIQVQYASFIIQVMFRAFTYGLAFSFISCNFPPQHIGKLIGVMMAIAGSISLLQQPIVMFVNTVLEGDPTYVNIAFAVFGCISFVHPIHVLYFTRSRAPPLPRLDDDVAVPLTPMRSESAA
jgi:LAT3 family solute carrier family 43 protein 3